MKAAFVCFYQAYPPASGAASVTYHCAKYFKGERFLVQLGADDRHERSPDGIEIITLKGPRSRLGKISGLRRRIARIVGQCKAIEPDVVVLEGASWVLYHWLLLRRLRREGFGASIVYHSHNVEYILRKEKHGRLISGITRWAEGRVLRNADRSFAVSDVDRANFERLYGVRTQLLPNGVDIEAFDRVREPDIAHVGAKYGLDGPVVLFMGMYAYRPNREAIDFLIRSVFPRILEQSPDARLAVLGGEIPYAAPWLLNPGNIPRQDLPAFLKACRVGVAPVFSGSGTRLKILEYLAAGLPVVSTRKGAEGLHLNDGESLILAEGAGAFAAGVVNVLENRRRAQALAASGQQVVRREYAWPAIMKNWHDTVGVVQRTS